MVPSIVFTAAAALLVALPARAGLYAKSSPVLQIDSKNYDRLIAQSNYTSIVEFYAPWCGHCKNLQPAYEKAARSLAGLAKVAAVDCDEEENKQFCGQFGVKGFPTLKIVKPGKKPGKPIVEDYQGARTAKGIAEAVTDKIPNLVKRVADKNLESFLVEANDTAKAILFSEKGKISALLKAVAIEFKGSISVAQIRSTEKASVELFGISKFPTLILLPGGTDTESNVYNGELRKELMVEFLSQAAAPNPDPAPPRIKLPKTSKDKKAASKFKAAFESVSASHAKSEKPITATQEILEEEPTESPSPEVDTQKPVVLPDLAPRIPTLATESALRETCLGPKTGTCILALVSSEPDSETDVIINVLSEIAHQYQSHDRLIFPFYVLEDTNEGFQKVKQGLGLDGKREIIALNGRRGWWRRISQEVYYMRDNIKATQENLENWIDAIRLDEGVKSTVPEGLIFGIDEGEKPSAAEDTEEPPEPQAPEEPRVDGTEVETQETTTIKHGDL